jgi:hypothetical protein
LERDIKSDKKLQTIVSQFLKENLHECHERVSPWPQNAKYSSVSQGYEDKERLY